MSNANEVRAGGAYIEIRADIAKLTHSLAEAKSRLDRFAGGVSSLFARLAASAGMVQFTRSAITAAANFERTEIRFRAAFGRLEDAASGWAKQMAAASGIGEGTLMGVMGDAQQLGRNLGFADDQAAEMSKTMTRLASDLATHFGDDVATAGQKVQMALMGSSRALRDYNIVVTEASARNALMQRGLLGAGEAMSAQQKAMGRLYAMLEQTTAAQGAATSQTNSWSQAWLRLAEMWTDFKEVVGAPLLEIFQPIVQGMTGVIQRMRDWVQENPAIIQGFTRLAGYVLGAVTAIKTAFAGLATFIAHRLTGITDHFRETLVWAGNAISSGFGDALGDMYDKSVTISDHIADVFAKMGAAILAQMKVFAAQFVAFLKSETMAEIENTTYGAFRSVGRFLARAMAPPGTGKHIGGWLDRMLPPAAVGGGGIDPATQERIDQLQAQADAAFGDVRQSAADLFRSFGWDFGTGDRPTPPPPGDLSFRIPGAPAMEFEPPTLPAGGVGGFMGARAAAEMMGFGRPDVEAQQLDTQKSMLGVLQNIRDNNALGAVLA